MYYLGFNNILHFKKKKIRLIGVGFGDLVVVEVVERVRDFNGELTQQC
jgi:GGDEF domain-containing protein